MTKSFHIQTSAIVGITLHRPFGQLARSSEAIRLFKTPGAIRRPAPQFGQHTEEVLTEVLGLSWDEVAKLREGEVI